MSLSDRNQEFYNKARTAVETFLEENFNEENMFDDIPDSISSEVGTMLMTTYKVIKLLEALNENRAMIVHPVSLNVVWDFETSQFVRESFRNDQ